MARTAVITGGSGFIGSHLAARLKAAGWSIEIPNLKIEDFVEVRSAFRAISQKFEKIDAIVHLAAVSSYQYTEAHPTESYHINIGGTAHVVQAIQESCPHAHLVFPSTAQVYRAPALNEEPVMNEAWPLLPRSIYAQTKLYSESILKDASKVYGLKCTVLRVFNHTHKSQSPEFFLPHIYHEILKAKTDPKSSLIEVGDLSVKRDLGAVSDLVSAFQAVLDNSEKLESFEIFNVCSGRARKLQDLAHLLAQKLDVAVSFHTDPKRLRPGDATSICGSHDRLKAKTGWQPKCVSDIELIENFLS